MFGKTNYVSQKPINHEGSNVGKTQTEEAAMKPAKPSTVHSRIATEDGKTEPPPTTRLRKVVFRGALFIVAFATMSTGCAFLPSGEAEKGAPNNWSRDVATGNPQPVANEGGVNYTYDTSRPARTPVGGETPAGVNYT